MSDRRVALVASGDIDNEGTRASVAWIIGIIEIGVFIFKVDREQLEVANLTLALNGVGAILGHTLRPEVIGRKKEVWSPRLRHLDIGDAQSDILLASPFVKDMDWNINSSMIADVEHFYCSVLAFFRSCRYGAILIERNHTYTEGCHLNFLLPQVIVGACGRIIHFCNLIVRINPQPHIVGTGGEELMLNQQRVNLSSSKGWAVAFKQCLTRGEVFENHPEGPCGKGSLIDPPDSNGDEIVAQWLG